MPRRTRRQFLADAARVAACVPAAAAGCFPGTGGRWAAERSDCALAAGAPAPARSTVAVAADEAVVHTDPQTRRNTIDPVAARAMVDRTLAALAGTAAPWSVLLPDATPATRVGIKVNTLNPSCPTSPAVARALVDSLRQGLSLPPEQILVWDRSDAELASAGFTEAVMGARVLGTLSSTGGPAPGYDGAYCVVNGKTTRLSRILTDLTDVTINCPVLKTHGVSGVTAALKNVYGIIDNPGDFHADLATALPAIYALGPIRGRIRLTVVDALIAITVGGTSSPVDTIPRRIFAATDPVAADSYAVALVNELRGAKNLGLGDVDARLVTWLAEARARGLGAVDYDLVGA
jgi:uncharacterized protein (DUF362 family)